MDQKTLQVIIELLTKGDTQTAVQELKKLDDTQKETSKSAEQVADKLDTIPPAANETADSLKKSRDRRKSCSGRDGLT